MYTMSFSVFTSPLIFFSQEMSSVLFIVTDRKIYDIYSSKTIESIHEKDLYLNRPFIKLITMFHFKGICRRIQI